MRHPDGATHELEIVATYARGLGFGGLVTGDDGATGPRDVAFVRAAPGQLETVRAAVATLGLESVDLESHVQDLASAGGGEQRLSQVLLLALLAFLGVACINTLVMLTVQRRRELRLLHRTGATRVQLVAMAGVESVLVAGGALLLGVLAVAPAIVSVGLSLGGGIAVDWGVLGWLAAVVVVISVMSILSAAVRTTRTVSTA